jgi:hypothetical protein
MTTIPQVAHRVEVPADTTTLAGADYASGFETARAATDTRSPEQWARATWEGAPRGVRGFLVTGWKLGLGLRLGSGSDHVLGWTVVTATPETIVLEARSGLLTAHNMVRVEDTRVLWTTFVRYEKPSARLLWRAAAPVHHLTLPYLLKLAAKQES